jgi:transposase-like protein
VDEFAKESGHYPGGVLRAGVEETLTYMAFPQEHWSRVQTNNALECVMKVVRRRTRLVGAFPDGQSALMLAAARRRHIAETKWGTRRYLDMDWLPVPEEGERTDGAVAV